MKNILNKNNKIKNKKINNNKAKTKEINDSKKNNCKINNKKIDNSKMNNKKIIKNKIIKLINKIKIKNKIKEKNNLEGIFTKKDYLSPSYINLSNPKYIEIDNLFYSNLIITNYYHEQNDLLLKTILDSNINMNISIFYERQNPYKVVKDLTYHIGNVGAELKTNNENREDSEIAAFTYKDAKYIRKEIQVNNEDIYFLYIYLNIYSEDKKELEYSINKIEGLLQSRGMQTRKSFFREEQTFKSCLPFMDNEKEIKNIAKRNVLTSGLICTYPFISSSICDKEGIFIGTNIYNNSLVFIDRYDSNKYKNANMCIFGSSGAGKSFYIKLLALRFRILGIEQYIIDPDREYTKLCKNLDGTLLKIGPNSNTYINIFDIRQESLEEGQSGYLATKISKLIGFFNLIFGNINEEEKAILEEKIIETYSKKGITFNDDSLFKKIKKGKVIFKNTMDMPILNDFYNILGKDKKTLNFKTKLIPFVKGSLNFFNNYTNVELNNKLIIADVYELRRRKLKIWNVFIY